MRFQDLIDDALKRVPAHSPAWTDFNQTDPAISLVQLWTWLSEGLGGRRPPEKHRRLLGRISRAQSKGQRSRLLIVGNGKRSRSAPIRFLAEKLGVKLQRVDDLSRIGSRYIGETEKNLERLFAKSEREGAILFFDEADALFGRHGAVRDSHDRYANMEVSYLLKRLERFDGIAIFAVSSGSRIDEAFLRRKRWFICRSFDKAVSKRRSFAQALPSKRRLKTR